MAGIYFDSKVNAYMARFVIAYAKEMIPGLEVIPDKDLHVTLMSVEEMDVGQQYEFRKWMTDDKVPIMDMQFNLKPQRIWDGLVVELECPAAQRMHNALAAMGLVHKYPDFNLHFTLSYKSDVPDDFILELPEKCKQSIFSDSVRSQMYQADWGENL